MPPELMEPPAGAVGTVRSAPVRHAQPYIDKPSDIAGFDGGELARIVRDRWEAGRRQTFKKARPVEMEALKRDIASSTPVWEAVLAPFGGDTMAWLRSVRGDLDGDE